MFENAETSIKPAYDEMTSAHLDEKLENFAI
jgi:hypothetical protein